MGRDDFTKIPNGIPSLEDRINLYFTHGVKGGRIDLHQFVETASTQGGENLRPIPAQRNDPTRERRRSGRLRSELSRQNFRENAPDESRLQLLRRIRNRRPPASRHRSRQGRGAGRKIRRRDRPRESFSRASRIISRFRRGAKTNQLLPNPGERRQRVSPRLTRMKTSISPAIEPSPETGSENIGERLSAHPFLAGTSENHLGILAATSHAGCAR